tara:strand:- start:20 stop:517 length:498 start_codon:yes stop_codon:yes gene_type:complete
MNKTAEVDYKIQENFLDEEEFKFMQDQFLGAYFPWYYQSNVVEYKGDNDYYFTHQMYVNLQWNNDRQLIQPLLDALNINALIRIKANLYPRSDKLITHKYHIDTEYTHTSSLLYINTNNGFTILEDGTKIKSVANRLLTIDGSKKHCSTNCTDKTARVNIGVNYF